MICEGVSVPYHAAGDKADASGIVVGSFRYGRVMYLRNEYYMGQELALYGEYSEGEVELWRSLIQPTWNVVDVGAHIGTHTLALSSLVPHGQVLAIEPLQFMYHILCGNLALNGITNVNALNVGIGDGAERLYLPRIDYTRWQNFGALSLPNRPTPASVPLYCLDDLCEHVNFLKIDVEGMELAVLNGAQGLIAESRPIIYAEANTDEETAALWSYLKALRYRAWLHRPPHYSPSNYFGDEMNIAPGVVSMNVLFLPKEFNVPESMNALTEVGDS